MREIFKIWGIFIPFWGMKMAIRGWEGIYLFFFEGGGGYSEWIFVLKKLLKSEEILKKAMPR